MSVTSTQSTSGSRRRGKLLVYALLILGGILMLLPFVWMLSTSLKTPAQVIAQPPTWLPNPFAWRNYVDFWTSPPVPGGFLRFTANTLLVTVICMIGEAFSATIVAYGFARYRFYGRDAWFMVLLATMMLPGAVTLVPSFIMFKELGWVDTYLPLTVGAYFGGGAFYIFLARQFFLTIPSELEEAARLDGCTDWQIFTRIFLPLSTPLLVTIAVFSFTAHWKDFMGPLIYLNSSDKFTLTLGLNWFKQSIIGQGATPYHLLMAATLVVVAPMIALFFLAQRAFTDGIAMSGLKE